ncbi:MAG TPA: VWA domain-containing protein [Xanthomonadaceae bacterium]|nr:VWA domain-containing protein [Xanthomonadaceae bacterium]
MPEFAWPWVAWLLPLPWLIAWLLPAASGEGAALRASFCAVAERWQARGGRRAGASSGRLWLALVWILLLSAAARPQILGEVQEQARSGRDLMLAVDLSGSMQAEDMVVAGRRVDRLTAVKLIAGDFIERRRGDRLGLIVFAQRAFLLTPLTYDHRSVREQLDQTFIGLAGRETAIGDAIGLAVKHLRDRPQQQRVLILLTDGVNNAGELDPERAAQIARIENVRIHTIGMGSDGGSQGAFGRRLLAPAADFDEAQLTRIAEGTGGRYFRARDTRDLAGIYAQIDQIESSEHEDEPYRPVHEIFHWPLGAAALAFSLALAVRQLREGLPA